MFNPDYHSSIDRSKYLTLNQNQLRYARDFYPTGQGTFTSLDPRLIDPIRGSRLTLNTPAFDGTLPAADRYDSTEVGVQTYRDYEDIRGGQVYYYVDSHFTQPYNSPNFQLRVKVEPDVFQDPMGGLNPQYHRTPISGAGYISGYRFDQDELSHREDIMAHQMSKRNQQDWQLYQNSYLTDFPLSSIPSVHGCQQ